MKNIATAKDPAARVRFPSDLLKQIDRVASKNGRSRNSEVIRLLRDGLTNDKSASRAG